MKAVVIVLIVICAVLALFYAVGIKFVRVLILRQDNFPTPEAGASSSSLLEPTGKALWAHNIPYFRPFRELPFDEISIVSDDGLTLRADMLRGSGTGKTVIFFHGYKSEPACDFAAMYDFYKSLGCDLIYVHMRAHGKSDGTYIGFGALDRYDVVQWTNKAAELFPDNDIYLHGMSMGAASILQSADLDLNKTCAALSPTAAIPILTRCSATLSASSITCRRCSLTFLNTLISSRPATASRRQARCAA